MSDSPKSYSRNASGPRAVDAGHSRDKGRTSSRRQRRDSDERGDKRSQRETNSQRSSKKPSSPRSKPSSVQPTEESVARPSFELIVIGQPERGIALGMPVETSAMLSLRLPAPDRSITADNVDTSRLFAVVSLVAEDRNGKMVPLENGVMTGQKLFDSVHPMPDECAERLASAQPCRLVLGYFSFPGLLIRQSGTYRIRTTLIKTSSTGGGETVMSVDSDVVKVERRGVPAPRRQRLYN